MGNYTMIADTGKRLVEMLQQALCPELIKNADEIGLRSPEDKGDVSLGLFLYDVRQSEEVFQQSNVVVQEQNMVTRISRPPVYLSLYYMITPYAKGDVMYRLYQEEQILGRIIQLFYDNPVIFWRMRRRLVRQGCISSCRSPIWMKSQRYGIFRIWAAACRCSIRCRRLRLTQG